MLEEIEAGEWRGECACGFSLHISHLLAPSKVLLRLSAVLLLPPLLWLLKRDQSDADSVLESLGVDELWEGDMPPFGEEFTAREKVGLLGRPVVPNHVDSSISLSIFHSISAMCFMKGSRSTDCGRDEGWLSERDIFVPP